MSKSYVLFFVPRTRAVQFTCVGRRALARVPNSPRARDEEKYIAKG